MANFQIPQVTNKNANQPQERLSYFNSLDYRARNIVVEATFKEVLTGDFEPGGLISYPNRGKAFTYKLSRSLINVNDLLSEMQKCINLHGEAYLPLNSRFQIKTLKESTTIILVFAGKIIADVEIAQNAILQKSLSANEETLVKSSLPSVWSFYQQKMLAGTSFNWIKVVSLDDQTFIPADQRVVISKYTTLDKVINSRSAVIICI